jgi:hypothetical protein
MMLNSLKMPLKKFVLNEDRTFDLDATARQWEMSRADLEKGMRLWIKITAYSSYFFFFMGILYAGVAVLDVIVLYEVYRIVDAINLIIGVFLGSIVFFGLGFYCVYGNYQLRMRRVVALNSILRRLFPSPSVRVN